MHWYLKFKATHTYFWQCLYTITSHLPTLQLRHTWCLLTATVCHLFWAVWFSFFTTLIICFASILFDICILFFSVCLTAVSQVHPVQCPVYSLACCGYLPPPCLPSSWSARLLPPLPGVFVLFELCDFSVFFCYFLHQNMKQPLSAWQVSCISGPN